MSVSLAAALEITAARLAARSDAPAREAIWLLEHVTGLDLRAQRQHRHQLLTAAQHAQWLLLLDRRASGEPLAYVLGTQPFWTLDLHVTPDVLIPRPETELLVERALHHLPKDEPLRVADLGTGSGAIALALAHERPNWELWATDASAAALAVAQGNAQRLGLHNTRFRQGSWCQALESARFHMILSNPPYIADGDPHLDPDVLHHEPRLALLSEQAGLQALTEIIHHAPAHLLPGGWLALEHGWQQAGAIQALLESAGFVGVASHADLAGHLRVTEGHCPERTR